MEGLIKGLINVALDGLGDHNNEDQSRDERSRSSWAQVVLGEQDKDEEGRVGQDYNHWNRNRRNEASEAVGEGYSRRPQKHEYGNQGGQQNFNQNQWNNKEEGEGKNEIWETVGKKPPKRHPKVTADHRNEYKRPPSEQEYSKEADYGNNVNLSVSEGELADLSHACNKLWELDLNRLVPGKDYQIDCGDGKKVYQKEDMAQGNLFYWLSEDVFKQPTYARFCSLLDNYNPNEGHKEVVTSEEKQEQAAFMEEISRTAPIKYLHKYLTQKGVISSNIEDFKRMMTSLWFDLYGRGGTSSCSSAFEHVFVGEIKQRGETEVSGFHNWLQFYLEEAKGTVDYQGYIFPRRRGKTPDSETQLLTVQFEWNDILKAFSSTLVGVSPEFEIALYTLCFFMGGEDNHVQLGPYFVNIKCYRLGRDKIGSVFPIAEN